MGDSIAWDKIAIGLSRSANLPTTFSSTPRMGLAASPIGPIFPTTPEIAPVPAIFPAKFLPISLSEFLKGFGTSAAGLGFGLIGVATGLGGSATGVAVGKARPPPISLAK